MTFSKLPDFNINLFHELTESDLIYSETWRRWAGRSTSRSQREEIPTYSRLVKASSRLPSSSRWLFPLMFPFKKRFLLKIEMYRGKGHSAHFIQDRDWRLALLYIITTRASTRKQRRWSVCVIIGRQMCSWSKKKGMQFVSLRSWKPEGALFVAAAIQQMKP